jgi:hypothetical protein
VNDLVRSVRTGEDVLELAMEKDDGAIWGRVDTPYEKVSREMMLMRWRSGGKAPMPTCDMFAAIFLWWIALITQSFAWIGRRSAAEQRWLGKLYMMGLYRSLNIPPGSPPRARERLQELRNVVGNMAVMY